MGLLMGHYVGLLRGIDPLLAFGSLVPRRRRLAQWRRPSASPISFARSHRLCANQHFAVVVRPDGR